MKTRVTSVTAISGLLKPPQATSSLQIADWTRWTSICKAKAPDRKEWNAIKGDCATWARTTVAECGVVDLLLLVIHHMYTRRSLGVPARYLKRQLNRETDSSTSHGALDTRNYCPGTWAYRMSSLQNLESHTHCASLLGQIWSNVGSRISKSEKAKTGLFPPFSTLGDL